MFPGAHSVGPHCPPGRSGLPETHGAAPLKLRNCGVVLSEAPAAGSQALFPEQAEAVSRAGSDPRSCIRPATANALHPVLGPQSDGRPCVAHPLLVQSCAGKDSLLARPLGVWKSPGPRWEMVVRSLSIPRPLLPQACPWPHASPRAGEGGLVLALSPGARIRARDGQSWGPGETMGSDGPL